MIVMMNNISENMTKDKRYNEKNQRKKNKKEWWKQYFEDNKERLEKWTNINAEDYLRKKKMKKESMQEISTGICLKKYGKEYRKNQYQKVFIEDRQKKKQMKKYRKNWSNSVLQKIKENCNFLFGYVSFYKINHTY